LLLAVILAGGWASLGRTTAAQPEPVPPVELVPVASGLDQPVDIADPGDASGRLFVLTKTGLVQIIQDGALLPEPFLDLGGLVDTSDLERGALGLLFHPDYAENGYFYVTYSPTVTSWLLARYRVSAENPNRADPASGTPIIAVTEQPHQGGHYGGDLALGPDGYLYVSIGDGGGEFDPYQHAQNLGSPMGKLLRIDVTSDPGQPYTVPADNPFVGEAGTRPEVWAYGLRNPWRFSFDRLTGDLWISDVGHVQWEEVNHQPAGSPGGWNYGWPLMEGPDCAPVNPGCDPALSVPPAVAYTHQEGCSVIGGFVYRGSTAAGVYGSYLFSDFCSGTLWVLQADGQGGWQRSVLLDTGLTVSTFGEDQAGNLYLADLASGTIYRIVPAACWELAGESAFSCRKARPF
jgi:glucose/arabinose dehydrogenase